MSLLIGHDDLRPLFASDSFYRTLFSVIKESLLRQRDEGPGVLIAAAGVGWLLFLWPPLAHSLLTYMEVLGVLGKLPLMLWLLVMGVNAQLWQERASERGGAWRLAHIQIRPKRTTTLVSRTYNRTRTFCGQV